MSLTVHFCHPRRPFAGLQMKSSEVKAGLKRDGKVFARSPEDAA